MEKVIGIIGGVGPYAGLDLLGKILSQTIASSDQEHLAIINVSRPGDIEDRTSFLLGNTNLNPAHAIADQILSLERVGAEVVGIPCNTAHAPPIFEVVSQILAHAGSKITLLHMIDEAVQFLKQTYPLVRRVGVLATQGTYQVGLYPDFLKPAGIEVIIPSRALQHAVHQAISDPDYGIKANGFATERAIKHLYIVGDELQRKGAEVVILGCTELPLAIRESKMGEMIVVDPTLVLARALIREANPAKLMPLAKP